MKKPLKKNQNPARWPRTVAGKRQKTRYSRWGTNEPGGCVCLVAGLIIMAAAVLLILLWLSMK